MKRYEKYKPSGIEWIGEIPEHWKYLRLKWVTKFFYGESLKNEDREEGDVPVFGSNGIVGYHSKAITEAPCLIIGRKGSYGKINYSESPCFPIDTTYFIDRKVTKNDLRWLFYALPVLKLDAYSIDSAVPGLSREEAYENILPLPTVDEQNAIANYLKRKTAQIDDLIAKKQKLIDLLNEEKTAIINQAVTKGVNPKVPMKESGIPWLGEIPAYWEIKKIKYIANLTLGKMLTGEDKGGNFLKPYLRAQNISWFKCDTSDVKEMWFSQSDLIKYRVNLNDLLVSEGGDVGRTCIWMNELDECYIQNSVHKITFKKYFNPKYFLYLFYSFGQKGYFLSIVNQISIGHLTGEKLKEVFTIFPGFDEQTAIVDYLDRKTDQMDDVISKTHHEIELLQEYRTALISEAVTGKIDVRI